MCGSKYSVDDPTFLCERCFKNTHFVQMDDDGNNDSLSESDVVKAAVETNDSDAKVEQKKQNLKKLFDFKAYHFAQL